MTDMALHSTADDEILHLDIAQGRERLKVSLASQQAGEMQTVRHVEELDVPMVRIQQQCRRMVATLNRANRQGRLTAELLEGLKESGQRFRDELLSGRIKEQLNATACRQLVVTLDDTLVSIPWELLHDGDRFLCQRFSMGRLVRTSHPMVGPQSRTRDLPLQMLILADPCADLASAYEEGIGIRNAMDDGSDRIWAALRTQGITLDFVQAKLRRYDLVHFAGHADYDEQDPEAGGWRLDEGRFNAARVIKMAGTGIMPSLVFANACQSGRSTHADAGIGIQDRIFDMANAFILAGVKHYIGTFWEVADESSRRFALHFYDHLRSGMSVGRAMQAARLALIELNGEENIIWASYLLYGDPSSTYLPAVEPDAPPVDHVVAAHVETATPIMPQPAGGLRKPEDVLPLGRQPVDRRRNLAASGLGVLVILAGLWIYFFGFGRDARQYEHQALAAFSAGNYAQAESACYDLRQKDPQRGLSYVLLGNIRFYQGNVEQARGFYQDAIQAPRSENSERAEALIGLGRIASEAGLTDQALNYYRQASDLTPANGRPYLAQAVLLEKQGEYQQAATVLQQAAAGVGEDPAVRAFSRQLAARAGYETDQTRQKRIDELIHDLEKEAADAPAKARRPVGEGPWTCWVMDFEEMGPTLQEGASRLLAGSISDLLLQGGRYQVVERALLDKILGELELGTSRLADPQGTLALGRLASANLILSGRMVHSAPHTQVSLRCIETETGRVIAMVNATYDTRTPVTAMASDLVEAITTRIEHHFSDRKPAPGPAR